MKFRFEGYPYCEGVDYIEIDFDFMEKSEFIKVLEPDLMVPVMIPERFEKYQIDEFKSILEKIGREEITKEDMVLCNSRVLKPLFEYFMMDKEKIKELCEITYSDIEIKKIRKYDEGFWKIQINIYFDDYCSEVYYCYLRKLILKDGIYEYFIGPGFERSKGFKITTSDLIEFENRIIKNYMGSLTFCLFKFSDRNKYSYAMINSLCEKTLLFRYFNDGNVFSHKIRNPIKFIKNFYKEIINI